MTLRPQTLIGFILIQLTLFHVSQVYAWDHHSAERTNQKIKFLLSKTKIGQKLLKDLEGLGQSAAVSFGENSKTVTRIQRVFSPNDRSIQYVRKSEIVLNKNQKLQELLMDFVHELTHTLYRNEQKIIYDPALTLSEYIRYGIEGRGGEAEAVQNECNFLFEFDAQKFKSHWCNDFLSKNKKIKKFNRKKLIKAFYKVGPESNETEELKNALDIDILKKISNAKEYFISSSVQKSYPLALLKEYRTINKKTCDNNIKLQNMKNISKSENSLHLQEFFERRCLASGN